MNKEIPVFGDLSFRDKKCLKEITEQINFVSWLKLNYPDYHRYLIHPKTEGKRTGAQISMEIRTGGLPTGASDLVIPGCPSFVVELKKADHTMSQWQPKQQPYLLFAKSLGCFVGVALGAEGAKEAFLKWHGIITANQK